jgi:ADP-dependent NAD(P)H-hydrate dehydratase / NAD(P)H-hydrate epimerase
MLLIAGIVPVPDLPLIKGKVETGNGTLLVDGNSIPYGQGTAAMLSSALAVTKYLNIEPPQALLIGDTGSGKGSKLLFKHLIKHIAQLSPQVLALHYWMPDLELMKELCSEIEQLDKKPLMIADAASMYTAKATGLAYMFDIFTPDASEIAFLADPDAIHPAYINQHLFNYDITKAPELIKKAHLQGSAAKLLLVKGAIDYIAVDGEIVETIHEPDVPILECIGGTGDTITGMVSAFTHAELEPYQAAIISAKANRVAGEMAGVTPGTRVEEIVKYLPKVFQKYLCSWSGVCTY